jgi:hypothetical protein
MGDAHITSETTWNAWRSACAAARCTPDVAAELRGFGARRFALYLRRYGSRTGHHGDDLVSPDEVHGWHLLETRCQTGSTRNGKRYKDWLLARAEGASDPVAALESGASLLLRDTVREYLRREYAPAVMDSLDRLMGCDSGSWSLKDLLPAPSDPIEAVGEREIDALARTLAEQWVEGLDDREGKLLSARHRGWPLYDPRLVTWSGTSKSSLHRVYHRLIHHLGDMVNQACPDATAGERVDLARRTLARAECEAGRRWTWEMQEAAFPE